MSCRTVGVSEVWESGSCGRACAIMVNSHGRSSTAVMVRSGAGVSPPCRAALLGHVQD